MANETPQQIATQAAQAGFTGTGLTDIVAIVEAESSGNPEAINQNTNGSTDYGLAQINSIHGVSQSAMFDPAQNLAEAYSLSDGGTNFAPWSTYNSGAYQKYLDEATGATSGIGASSTPANPITAATSAGGSTTGSGASKAGASNTAGQSGAAGQAGSGSSVTTVALDTQGQTLNIFGQIAADLADLTAPLSVIEKFFEGLLWFTHAQSWIRIGCFIGGLFILGFGLHYIGKEIRA